MPRYRQVSPHRPSSLRLTRSALVSKMLSVVLLVVGLVNRVACEEGQLNFLLAGQTLTFDEQMKIIDTELLIYLEPELKNFDQVETSITEIINKYTDLNAFNLSNGGSREMKDKYLHLIQPGILDLIKIVNYTTRIQGFQGSQVINPLKPCSYIYHPKTLQWVKQELEEVKVFADKVSNWNAEELKGDPNKVQKIMEFTNAVNSMISEWERDTTTTLNILDQLASHKFPVQLQGIFESIDCMKNQTGESIRVKSCNATGNGYLCELHIELPIKTVSVRELIPVHYRGIRIRGETHEQLFVQQIGQKGIYYLQCNEYIFDDDTMPICEILDIELNCKKAIEKVNFDEEIKFCNFTRHEPPPYVVLPDRGVLIQQTGSELKWEKSGQLREEALFIPSVVYAKTDILITIGELSFEIELNYPDLEWGIVYSIISIDQLNRLETRLFWIELSESIDIEDILDYVTISLQAIFGPVALLGLIMAIKNRFKGSKIVRNIRTPKGNYASNKMMMKRLAPK